MTEKIELESDISAPTVGEAGKLRLIAFILDNFVGWVVAIMVAKFGDMVGNAVVVRRNTNISEN